MNPPVIDYERMKRMYPQVVAGPKDYNIMTGLCVFFITIGVLVLIHRYKRKQSFSL